MSRRCARQLMAAWIDVDSIVAHLQGGGGQHAELSGYHAKRHEFEPEYDQDAELMVSELEFRESDTQVCCPAQCHSCTASCPAPSTPHSLPQQP